MSKVSRGPKLDNMKVRHTIRIGDDEDKRIKEYCERTGVNRSDLYREAINRLLNLKEAHSGDRK